MIDIHTHLLPAVDDGSRNERESLELMKRLGDMGFDSFVLTPHFYPHKELFEDFIRRRGEAFENFKAVCPQQDIRLGCECYIHSNLFATDDITQLCIQNTGDKKYILVELSYSKTDADYMMKMCQRLIEVYGVELILAHIERYPYMMKSEQYVRDMIAMGCKCQVNIKSFSEYFLRERLAQYLKDGYISFLGSDSHRFPFESQRYAAAARFLHDNFGSGWRNMFKTL